MTPTRMSAVIAVAAAVACQDPVSPAPSVGRDAAVARAAPPDAAAVGPPGGAAAPAAPAAAVKQGPPRVVAMDAPPVALPSQESFRLLSPGRGARAALRYTLAAGTTAMMARSTLRSRRLDRGAFSRPVALPAIRDGFEVAVEAARTDRVALRPVVGQAAAASPDADAYLAPWRTLLQGRPIALSLDDRGQVTAIQFDDDRSGATSVQARDELVQRLLSLIVPLPTEPVGTGASWRAVTILRQGPAIARQTATYTLIARGPARWKLHVKLQRIGEQQQIVDPALPRGTTAELVALFRALEGDVEVDPALPLIAGGSLAIESRLHARLQLPASAGAAGKPAVVEQMFEDTGKVSFARCRRLARAAVHPVARAAAPRARAALTVCPDGYAPR